MKHKSNTLTTIPTAIIKKNNSYKEANSIPIARNYMPALFHGLVQALQ